MALPFDLLLQGCRLPDGRIADVGARAGLVAEIGTLAGRSAHRAVDCGGLLLTPGLVDAHIHLDKALLSDRTPSLEGTVAEALRVTGHAKRRFTVLGQVNRPGSFEMPDGSPGGIDLLEAVARKLGRTRDEDILG